MIGRVAKRLRAYAEKNGRGYPDWVMRYAPVVRRVRDRGPLDGKRILEIGANQNGFARFARVPIVAVDVEWEQILAFRETQAGCGVAADIAALPFRDHSVDLCVCIDTFEHLPPPIRLDAVEAIARVLSPRGVAVVGFPSGEAAARAEAAIRDAYYLHTRNHLRWLEEHKQYRLPCAADIAHAFEARLGATHTVTIVPNANVRVWMLVWKILLCGWPRHANSLAQVLLRWSAPALTRAHRGTCYRAMIWVEPRQP